MKEVKNTQIQIRISPAEKEQIQKFAAEHNMTTSEFIRWACNKIFEKENV